MRAKKIKIRYISFILLFGLVISFIRGTPIYAEGDVGSTTIDVFLVNLGSVSIDSVPSFNFGTQTLSKFDNTYLATGTTGTLKVSTGISVLDKWKVVASMDNFKYVSDGHQIMTGATITLLNGTVASNILGTPTVNQTIVLTQGGAPVNVESMLSIVSLTNWSTTWKNENIKLFVPKASVTRTGSVSATITWALQNAL